MWGCNADSFQGEDGGPDGSGDVGNDTGVTTDATSGGDGSISEGGHSDAIVEDVISLPDVFADVAVGPTVQCNASDTLQCPVPSEVCCGDLYWQNSSCVALSNCTGTNSHPLACDNVNDCPKGQICCADVLNSGIINVADSYCWTSCVSSQRQLCRQASECVGGLTKCVPLPSGSTPVWINECQ